MIGHIYFHSQNALVIIVEMDTTLTTNIPQDVPIIFLSQERGQNDFVCFSGV